MKRFLFAVGVLGLMVVKGFAPPPPIGGVISPGGSGSGGSVDTNVIINIISNQLSFIIPFNVRDYGAYGTNANDQVAIQNAYWAAARWAGTNQGAIAGVFFPPGTYGLGTNFFNTAYVTETYQSSLIAPSNNVGFFAMTPGSVVLTQMVYHASGNQMIATGSDSGNKTTNFFCQNIVFRAKRAIANDITQIQGTYNAIFTGCSFYDGGQDAVDVQAGGETTVLNSYFYNMRANDISAQNPIVNVQNCYFYRTNSNENWSFDAVNTVFNVNQCVWYNASQVLRGGGNFSECQINSAAGTFTNMFVIEDSTFNQVVFNGNHNGPNISAQGSSGGLRVVDCKLFGVQDVGAIENFTPGPVVIDNCRWNVGTYVFRQTGGNAGVTFVNNQQVAAEVRFITTAVNNVIFANNSFLANVDLRSGSTNILFTGNSMQNGALLRLIDNERGKIVGNNMDNATLRFEGAIPIGGMTVENNKIGTVTWLATANSIIFRNNLIQATNGFGTGNMGGITNSIWDNNANFAGIPMYGVPLYTNMGYYIGDGRQLTNTSGGSITWGYNLGFLVPLPANNVKLDSSAGNALYLDKVHSTDGVNMIDCTAGGTPFVAKTTGARSITIDDAQGITLNALTRNITYTSGSNNFGGTVVAGVGLQTSSRNKLALLSIAVGASPFSFTNSFVTNNMQVFIGGGTVTQIAINGSNTAMTQSAPTLQPGEWTTVTYSVTPTMTWKPF